jgi:hypothetical protein
MRPQRGRKSNAKGAVGLACAARERRERVGRQHGAVKGKLPDGELVELGVIKGIHAAELDLGVVLCAEPHEQVQELLHEPRDVLSRWLGQLLLGQGAAELIHALHDLACSQHRERVVRRHLLLPANGTSSLWASSPLSLPVKNLPQKLKSFSNSTTFFSIQEEETAAVDWSNFFPCSPKSSDLDPRCRNRWVEGSRGRRGRPGRHQVYFTFARQSF